MSQRRAKKPPPLGATQVAANCATPAELAALGDQIYASVKASGVAAADDEGNDQLFIELRRRHRDFAHSFPVVLRWMVQARDYDTRAFKAYLKKIKTPYWNSRQDFLESQADYLAILYRTRNPRCGPKRLQKYRLGMLRHLEKEDEEFADAHQQAQEEAARVLKAVILDRRRRLFEFLVSGGSAGGSPKPGR